MLSLLIPYKQSWNLKVILKLVVAKFKLALARSLNTPKATEFTDANSLLA